MIGLRAIINKVGAYPLLIGMAFVWVSCMSAVPHLSKQQLDDAKSKHIDLEAGRRTYINNCSGCHELHTPAEFNKTQWMQIFPKMSQKAHLSISDSTEALAYLCAAAKPNEVQ